MSLCHRWQQSSHAAAQRLFVEVYGEFLEGFGTPRLHDTQELPAV
jgi:hypothetical protein